MSKLPVLKPREVIRLLEKQGFVEVRQRGSHKQFRHSDGRATTVPCHLGRDISPSLFRVIARDIGTTAESLLGLTERESQSPESSDENLIHPDRDDSNASEFNNSSDDTDTDSSCSPSDC